MDTEQIKPETDEKEEKTPDTERISPEDTQTVRIGPEEQQVLEEPMNDKLFDQYTVYSKIGTGGMGIVYLARDRRLGRFVAIKRLNRQAQKNPSLRKRFLQEARAVAALSHVHIVHIYSLGEDEDGPFIVMEYIAGPDDPSVHQEEKTSGLTQPNQPLTLDQLVTRHGPLQTDDAIELILKISRAVAYAHQAGVIHRDLKPSNILLDKSNEPKIVDFGLARLMHKDLTKLTVPGEKLLSLGYGAPEQESDASLSDERADVYGLGALLYFTLTGLNPRYFREQDIPVSLREVVTKALATDREQRWPSATAFTEALHNVQTKTRIETPTIKTTWRCKWCDAINPLTTKFCAECGWDGSEHCPECGMDSFVGIQYCGNCGADARAYESVLQTLGKMREAMEQQRFERVVSYAGRIHDFEPAGPSGRKYLNEIISMRTGAEESIRKREEIRGQIPIELRAENFERASIFIKRFRELSEDKHAFELEEQKIPEQILHRDLIRAKRALKNHEWMSAAQICEDLQNVISSDDPDIRNIMKALRRHAIFSDIRTALAIFLGIVSVYLLCLPFVTHIQSEKAVPVVRPVFKPGYLFYKIPKISSALGVYARWLMPEGMTLQAWFEPTDSLKRPELDPDIPPPDSLKRKREEYAKLLEEINKSKESFNKAWPLEYIRELEELMEEYRTSGNFDGWEVIRNEYNRFQEKKELAKVHPMGKTRAPALDTLRNKYLQMLEDQKLSESRRLVNLCKKYINDLSDLLKVFMQEGKMDLAQMINAEIRRAKSSAQQLEADAIVAEATKDEAAPGTTPQVIIPPTTVTKVQQMESMRKTFDKELTDLEKKVSKQKADWPENYLARLIELMDSFQQAGDFAGWEGARSEISRFEADRTVKEKDIIQYPSELAALQQRFIQLSGEIKTNRAKQIVSITEKYEKNLKDLQKKLTVGGQMDAATVVNAEIRRVNTRSDYLTALKELNPEPPEEGAPQEKPAEPRQNARPAKHSKSGSGKAE